LGKLVGCENTLKPKSESLNASITFHNPILSIYLSGKDYARMQVNAENWLFACAYNIF
jgi:hypothetical protein